MNLDLWILAVVGVFGAIGLYTGAIQQLSHWIGIVAAYLCAKPIAALIAPALAGRMGWPPELAAVGLSAVSMPVVFIVVTLVARGILNALIPGKQRNLPDRLAGILLGAGKAAVIVWVALAAVLAFEEPLVKYLPGAEDALNASSAAAFTRKHGFFDTSSLSALKKFRAVAAMRDDPKLAKALFSDPAVKRALEKGDASALLKNPEIKKLLEDPELAKKIDSLTAR